MRFIHTADLHLDSPFDNLRDDRTPNEIWNLVYRSTYRSFARIVREAVERQVDFVLIVGDLFDRQGQNVRAQNFLKEQLTILAQHRIPVFLSFGNHDYYSGDYHQLDYPANTFVFPQQVTTKALRLKDGTLVHITGFSYGSRWEKQRMIDKFPVKSDCDYQIGMIHGQISSGASNYTPFSLNELLSKHYDYWALGHIHKRQIINRKPPVVYPGNIQGRNPNETGDKGYLLVDSQQHLQPEFHPTSVINWSSLLVDLKDVSDETDLVQQILDQLQQQRYSKFHLVNVELKAGAETKLPSDLLTLIKNQNLLDQVQAVLEDRYQDYNAWIYQIDLAQASHSNNEALKSKVWKQSADKVFQLKNVDQLAKKLFQQPFINRTYNNPAAIQHLKDEVTQMIANHGSSQNDN